MAGGRFLLHSFQICKHYMCVVSFIFTPFKYVNITLLLFPCAILSICKRVLALFMFFLNISLHFHTFQKMGKIDYLFYVCICIKGKQLDRKDCEVQVLHLWRGLLCFSLSRQCHKIKTVFILFTNGHNELSHFYTLHNWHNELLGW